MRPTSGIVRFTPIDEEGRTIGPSTLVNAESIEVAGTEIDTDTDAEAAADGERLAKLTAGFAAIGEATRDVLDHIRGPFEAAFAGIAASFGRAAYLPPSWGRPPSGAPMRTYYEALYALNWATDTTVLRRLPKPARRYAKARYLECRRVLGPTAWRSHLARRGGVSINQFVST